MNADTADTRLRKAGLSKSQRRALLAECTDDETEGIAAAATGEDLRKVIDHITDRLNTDTELTDDE